MSDIYKKPQFNAAQLCNKLRLQGLKIHSESAAQDVLNRCSYYRFKAYLRPFLLDVQRKTYKDDSSFENAKELYLFDGKLRCLLFEFIQKIEIAIRSRLDYWITSVGKNPYWYLDFSIFNDSADPRSKYRKTIDKVKTYFYNSNEEFAKHFKYNYRNDFSQEYSGLPPAWVAIELMTFGNVTELMANINTSSRHSLKMKRFASKMAGVPDFNTLLNWLDGIKDIRNICCHHSRLFNRNIVAFKGIQKYIDLLDIVIDGNNIRRHNRIYGAVASIQILLNNIGYEKIGPKIKKLFEEFPIAKKQMDSMGFPVDWENNLLFFDEKIA